MNIYYSEKASKQLKKISKGDRNGSQLILKTIEKLADKSLGNFDMKILKGKFATFKRLHVGNYRIIFEDKENVLYIYEIKHRQGAYK